MLRLLFTRRWLGALLAAVVFAIGAYYLGSWQWHRHAAKVERNQLLDEHYAMTPVPLDRALAADGTLPPGKEWMHVSAQGRYAADAQLLVRNRTQGGTAGYEVIAPLDVGGNRILLVDRGWLPNSTQGAAVTPDVPAVPSGSVTVSGWLRRPEPSLGRDLPTGQLASIATADASRALGRAVLPTYLILDTEQAASGATAQRPRPLDPPERSLGPHQAYAYQWWFSALAGFGLVFFGIRREAQAGEVRAGTRARKQRIWEEEDE